MHKVTGRAVTLIFLLAFSGCGDLSPFRDIFVRIHFSPAITVDQAMAYAELHKSNMFSYQLASMDVIKTDSGKVAVEYKEMDGETKFNNLHRPQIKLPDNFEIANEELKSRLSSHFYRMQQFYAERILEREAELELLEERIANTRAQPSIEERLIRATEATEGMTKEESRKWINRNFFHGYNDIERLERERQWLMKYSEMLRKQHNGLSLVDDSTYMQLVRIESIVLKVKQYQLLDQSFPVSHVIRQQERWKIPWLD